MPKCDSSVHSCKCFSLFCYRATIELDICQQTVILLGGNFDTRCYIAVNRVRICAALGPRGTAESGIPDRACDVVAVDGNCIENAFTYFSHVTSEMANKASKFIGISRTSVLLFSICWQS